VDVHSHVVPSGDDGAVTVEEGISRTVEHFRELPNLIDSGDVRKSCG